MKAVKIIIPILISTCFLCLKIKAQVLSWQLTDTSGQFLLKLTKVDLAENATVKDLQVFVGEKKEWPGSTAPAVLGTVSQENGNFLFRPSFSFRVGVRYTAFWKQGSGFSFSIPRTGTTTELTAIYPSVTSVPANLLKIYLHFSAPMGEGRAYEHLTLSDAAGDTVQQPFVPLQPELWSEDRKRLTLWLDPGRVKRGLLSHETHGAVLVEGKEYLLQIHPDWKDATGQPLGKHYQKQFRVIAPDYQHPLPEHWKIQPPKAGSTEPLIVDFGEPLDQALAGQYLQVLQGDDLPIPGTVVLKKGESVWHFFSTEPWSEGSYTLLINSSLEDLAGNNLNRPFDRDVKEGDQEISTEPVSTLDFIIKRTE